VKNTGNIAGDEVVELYLTQPKGFQTPQHELAAFTRIRLDAGATAHIGLTLDPRSIAQVDEKGTRVILPGAYTVSLGGSQPTDATQAATVTITGQKELPR
jgi:beta-glucosidase